MSSPEHAEEFKVIMKEMIDVPIFKYHDPSKPLTLQIDAPLKCLGVATSIYFARQSLQPHQKSNVANELESLAVT